MDEQYPNPQQPDPQQPRYDGSGYPEQPRNDGPRYSDQPGIDGPGYSGQPQQGPREEHTRPLPPYQPGYPQSGAQSSPQGNPQGNPLGVGGFGTRTLPPVPAQESPRGRGRGRGLAAGVLVAAVVLGGAAGVGGSAAYREFSDDGSGSGSGGTSEKFEATKTATVQDGTVEKVSNSVLPSVVKVNVTGQSGSGSGSGIVLSEDGEILTNNHVVAGVGDSGSITVNFNDGATKKATVVGTDPLTDIAVIKVAKFDGLTPASLGKSGSLNVGQTVVAVGSPFGLNATVTSGIVSALNRPVSVAAEEEQDQQQPFGQGQQQGGADLSTTYPAIQTDAAINPGNSGGPLVDLSGRVVGINSSIRTASSAGSEAGGSIGLGFAIPIDEVLPIVNQITDGDKPTHARLGVSVSDVTGDTTSQGAVLKTIEGGGAAADADLKVGDVITKVGDQVIDGSESLVATIRGHRPGEKVEITYLRGGKSQTTTADLGSDANNTAS